MTTDGGHAMVDRCVCHNITLAQLKEVAREVGPDFDALSRRTGCGTGCGLCIPYVREMLRTGATVVPWRFDNAPRGAGE